MMILAIVALAMAGCTTQPKNDAALTLDPASMTTVGQVSERYQSYNVEMVEVVGGTFWRPYAQMEKDENGNVIFPELGEGYDVSAKNDRMYIKLQPIDFSNPRLIALARGLAPAYMRISGTWANACYFQDDDQPARTAPEGFVNVLTRNQWNGVVQFSKDADAQIVTSFAVSNGTRDENGVWTPVEAQKLLNATREQGGTIAAAELFNEPTMPTAGGEMSPDYNAQSYAKDMQVFYKWAKENTPETIILAPGTVGEGLNNVDFSLLGSGMITAEEFLTAQPTVQFDNFSFHHYGAASMRMFRNGEPFSISKENALKPEWIQLTDNVLEHYKGLRDRFKPEAKLWNTETAQAAAGGDLYATTYRDVFRYLYQLASNARNGLYVHMHNTLVASEYSLIDQTTLDPKPNYWAAYLWNTLMGTEVLDAGKCESTGVYIFAHRTKNSDKGVTMLIINTTEQPITFNLTTPAQQFQLTANSLDDRSVLLNGQALQVGSDNILPTLTGTPVEAGSITIPPLSNTFLTAQQ